MKIIFDCDPGHDDAIALLLALASPEVELVGVTTVHGNQTLEKTTINALKLLEFVGRTEIPVAAGAAASALPRAVHRRERPRGERHGRPDAAGSVDRARPAPCRGLHRRDPARLGRARDAGPDGTADEHRASSSRCTRTLRRRSTASS